MDGVYLVEDAEGNAVTQVGSCHDFYNDFFELKVRAMRASAAPAWAREPVCRSPSGVCCVLLVQHIVSSGPVKTYSYKRLQVRGLGGGEAVRSSCLRLNSFDWLLDRLVQVLEARFNLHKLLNSDRELEAQKSVPHRYYYGRRRRPGSL